DIAIRSGEQADMRAAFIRDLRHVGAQIEPELRIALAEADRRRPAHQPREPERCQHRLVETRRTVEVGNTDGDVVDHGYLQRPCWRKYLHGMHSRPKPTQNV